jgi:small subunit ribosomal protein S17
MKKEIGIDVKNKPKDKCEDPKCPYHGKISLHGRTFTGTVVSDKMHRSVTITWERRIFIPKYERYARRFSRLKAHNPDCINAKTGDIVRVMETRPISKTKNFVVIEIIKKKE